jgi:hydrogenase expression/formation protein HypE
MKEGRILLAHGSGGKLGHNLINQVFLKAFSNPILKKLDDSAVLNTTGSKLAFTTDTYVVNPIFFPGGDIGRLAICGTVNDLSMSGANPTYVSVSFVLEEGFLVSDLEKILSSMIEACVEAGVTIATGDTKVVERGSVDGIFINTAGVGTINEGIEISGSNIKVGDKIILSGSIGDHGIAVMSKREGLRFETQVRSDCAPLNHLVARMLETSRKIHALRDPTRGGIASTLNEFASQSKLGIIIDEGKILLEEGVLGACEMLGLDPLQVANEGKLVAAVAPDDAEKVLEVMRETKYGEKAEIVGEATEEPIGRVLVKTAVGTTRILDMLVGEQLPRIC